MWVQNDIMNPMQLCLNGLTQISTLLLKDAVVRSCTGFAKTGCEGKGGMRATKKQTYSIPAPKCLQFLSHDLELHMANGFQKAHK